MFVRAFAIAIPFLLSIAAEAKLKDCRPGFSEANTCYCEDDRSGGYIQDFPCDRLSCENMTQSYAAAQSCQPGERGVTCFVGNPQVSSGRCSVFIPRVLQSQSAHERCTEAVDSVNADGNSSDDIKWFAFPNPFCLLPGSIFAPISGYELQSAIEGSND